VVTVVKFGCSSAHKLLSCEEAMTAVVKRVLIATQPASRTYS
jgi:hypothetical protein